MKLLSLFGLDRRIRQLHIAADEAALAAEDRAQLLGMAWDVEKHRLQRMFSLAIVVLGLTTVMVALLSVAVVVQFWDTPNRVTAAWSVALVWLVLWFGALIGLVATARGSANGFSAAGLELGSDWAWLRRRLGSDTVRRPRQLPAASLDELLARIAKQRERVVTLETPVPSTLVGEAGRKPPAAKESATEAALRLARAHPVAAGALAAGAVVVLGPRRLVRLAGWLAPFLWRMR